MLRLDYGPMTTDDASFSPSLVAESKVFHPHNGTTDDSMPALTGPPARDTSTTAYIRPHR